MLDATIQVIRASLKADTSLTTIDRNRILTGLRGSKPPEYHPEPKIAKRAEAAARLGLGLRAFDGLCKSGALQKIKLPGRVRACGVRESDLVALIEGRTP